MNIPFGKNYSGCSYNLYNIIASIITSSTFLVKKFSQTHHDFVGFYFLKSFKNKKIKWRCIRLDNISKISLDMFRENIEFDTTINKFLLVVPLIRRNLVINYNSTCDLLCDAVIASWAKQSRGIMHLSDSDEIASLRSQWHGKFSQVIFTAILNTLRIKKGQHGKWKKSNLYRKYPS